MLVSIDNLSGAGPIDYSGSIDGSMGVTIKRILNAPTKCTFAFLPQAQGLGIPLRYARVVVSDAAGVMIFTGYVAAPPEFVLQGVGVTGLTYQAIVNAVSDELLLDSMLSVKTGSVLNQDAPQALQAVTAFSGASPLNVNAGPKSPLIGRYVAKAATKWSENAGALAASVRSAYNSINDVVNIAPIGTVTHTLNEADGSLKIGNLKMSAVKLLANDVTVCGRIEPAAYVTEVFQGDGVTTIFTLTSKPFNAVAAERLSFVDLFQAASLNALIWQWADVGERLSITGNGVTCAGGTGRDGETVLSAIRQVELGGSIVLQAGGVQLSANSQGFLLGIYAGSVSMSNCIAGCQVSQAGGVTQLQAFINASAAGSTFVPTAGHVYTLRLHVYCPEMERVQSSYYYLDVNGPGSNGGEVIVAPGRLVLEIQDVTGGILGPVTVLYDGSIVQLPPVATIGLNRCR